MHLRKDSNLDLKESIKEVRAGFRGRHYHTASPSQSVTKVQRRRRCETLSEIGHKRLCAFRGADLLGLFSKVLIYCEKVL